jgi:hypothetical protein
MMLPDCTDIDIIWSGLSNGDYLVCVWIYSSLCYCYDCVIEWQGKNNSFVGWVRNSWSLCVRCSGICVIGTVSLGLVCQCRLDIHFRRDVVDEVIPIMHIFVCLDIMGKQVRFLGVVIPRILHRWWSIRCMWQRYVRPCETNYTQ